MSVSFTTIFSRKAELIKTETVNRTFNEEVWIFCLRQGGFDLEKCARVVVIFARSINSRSRHFQDFEVFFFILAKLICPFQEFCKIKTSFARSCNKFARIMHYVARFYKAPCMNVAKNAFFLG